MNPASLWLIALGGALGSVARALTAWVIPTGRLPWATLCVNVIGSLLIGWLMARLSVAPGEGLKVHSFAVAGFCGGFTTFSAFSWQTFEQMQKGHWGTALLHIALSMGLCLAATWVGWRIAK